MSLDEVRETLIARGQAKYGDAVWSWPWEDVWAAMREELADAAVWAWVLWVRAEHLDEPARCVVRLQALRTRDLVARAWAMAGLVLPIGGEWPVAPCAPQALGAALPMFGTPSRTIDARASGFAAVVAARAVHGQAKYGDRSFVAPIREILRELGEELVSAELWAEIAWQRVTRDPRISPESVVRDRACAAELIRAARHAHDRLGALDLVLVDTDGTAPGAPAPDAVTEWLTLAARAG